MKLEVAATLALVATLRIATALAQTAPAPDNTKSNAAPVNSSMNASVADGQKNLASDLKITQQIRKSVIADKSLSADAHNVKIVSVNGAVTLNGVVRSAHEKSVVEMKAKTVAGTDKVTSDLTVAPNS
jgi:hyperosmotically inducible periplasmic protein